MVSLKSICIPAAPPVSVNGFTEILDDEHFQALRERKQLGVNYLIFPGAVHTRFEHAIGVLSLAQRLCRVQGFGENDGRLLQAFALLHDIGHGPFSHQTEPVLAMNHHDHGRLVLREMAPVLNAMGLDVEALEAMLTGTHPLATWISDRNLGADKLDYLQRDALHIGFHGAPDIERLQFYTRRLPEGLAIDGKYMEDAKQLQKFYSYLHQHGYLNKTALAAQRMLQRALQEELLEGFLQEQDIWRMGDAQLLAALANGRSLLGRRLVAALTRRNLHCTALALKPAGYGFVERQGDGKALEVCEWSRQELRSLSSRLENLTELRKLEDGLAEWLHLEKGEVLFAAMPYFKKLIPKDLRVCDGQGGGFWLLENDMDHRRSLESDYLRTFAVRLLVPRPRRQEVFGKCEPLLRELI